MSHPFYSHLISLMVSSFQAGSPVCQLCHKTDSWPVGFIEGLILLWFKTCVVAALSCIMCVKKWVHTMSQKSELSESPVTFFSLVLNNVQEPRTCLSCWWRNLCLSRRGLISSRNVPERTSSALRHPAARPCLAHLHSSDLCHASLLTWLTTSSGITAGLNVETVLTSIWLPGSGGGQEEEMQKREGRLTAVCLFPWHSHFIFSSSHLHIFLLLMFILFHTIFSHFSFSYYIMRNIYWYFFQDPWMCGKPLVQLLEKDAVVRKQLQHDAAITPIRERTSHL